MLKSNVFGYVRGRPNGGRANKIFAVRITPGRWGFIRFRRGVGFGFLPVCSSRCGIPRLNWDVDPEPWFAGEWSGTEKYESDDYVLVGTRPAADPWTPDLFQRPQYPWQPWMIFRRDQLVRVNGPEDLAGIPEAVWLSPTRITEFLRQKHEAGALAEVEVDPPEPSVADPADAAAGSELPTIVYAKIVQGIGPAERERIYEEPLAEFLSERDLGEVTGGGTLSGGDGTIVYAGIDIEVRDVKRGVPLIARKLAALGAPEGSQLEYFVDDEPVVYPIRKPRRRP